MEQSDPRLTPCFCPRPASVEFPTSWLWLEGSITTTQCGMMMMQFECVVQFSFNHVPTLSHIYRLLCSFVFVSLSSKLSPQCWSVSTVKTLLLPASSEAPKGSAPCLVPKGTSTCMKYNLCSRSHVRNKPRCAAESCSRCSLVSLSVENNKWLQLSRSTRRSVLYSHVATAACFTACVFSVVTF